MGIVDRDIQVLNCAQFHEPCYKNSVSHQWWLITDIQNV